MPTDVLTTKIVQLEELRPPKDAQCRKFQPILEILRIITSDGHRNFQCSLSESSPFGFRSELLRICGKLENYDSERFSIGIKPPPLYILEDQGQLSYPTHKKTNILPLFYPLLPSTYSSHSLLSLQYWWIDDGSSRAVKPARAAQTRRTPRRGPSRACGVSGFKRPHRCVLHITLPMRLLWQHVLRIALIINGGIRFECERTLGASRPKSWLGPTSSDLTPYPSADLIKRQHTFWQSRSTKMADEKLSADHFPEEIR
jgi:hypothetical protein